jgi:predicted DNA binding CopG/RHH family protein
MKCYMGGMLMQLTIAAPVRRKLLPPASPLCAVLTTLPARRNWNTMKFPDFKSDAVAEAFVATADLSTYDFSNFTPVRFELQPKTERVNMRLPSALLEAIRKKAKAERLPYQRFIRIALEQAVAGKK